MYNERPARIAETDRLPNIVESIVANQCLRDARVEFNSDILEQSHARLGS